MAKKSEKQNIYRDIKEQKDNLTGLQNVIFQTSPTKLACLKEEISDKNYKPFWTVVLETAGNLNYRESLADNVLSKISIYKEEEKKKGTYNEYSDNYYKINTFQAETYLVKGKHILDKVLTNVKAYGVLLQAKGGIESLELSYLIYQSLLNNDSQKSNNEYLINQIKIIKEQLNNLATAVPNEQEQFALFKNALDFRKQNLPDNKDYWVDLLIKLGSYGIKIKDEKIKVEALKFVQDAYNIIYEKPLTKDSATELKSVLEIMQFLYENFGDAGKAQFLGNQIDSIKQKFNIVEQKEKTENKQEKTECLLINVIKQGVFDQKILDVKKQIQKTVLDKVQEAAAAGKWVNLQFVVIEYGVSGYLKEDYLKGKLGILNDKEGNNYKIALELCFEAINIGIMNSTSKNPICAAIFCKKYPEIIKDIIEKHPEYFVDGHILKTSLVNASQHSKKLINEDVEEHVGYNKHFEKAVMPVMAKYEHNNSILSTSGITKGSKVTTNILEPIKNSISKGESLETTKLLLKSKLDDKFILEVLGKNFTHLEDVYNIVKIMAFETMAKTIREIDSNNFESIKFFNTQFPELAIRINKSHPEYYFEDKHIKEICRSFVESEKKKIAEQEEKKRLEIIEKERLEEERLEKEREQKKIEETKQKFLEEQKRKEEERLEKEREQKKIEEAKQQKFLEEQKRKEEEERLEKEQELLKEKKEDTAASEPPVFPIPKNQETVLPTGEVQEGGETN